MKGKLKSGPRGKHLKSRQSLFSWFIPRPDFFLNGHGKIVVEFQREKKCFLLPHFVTHSHLSFQEVCVLLKCGGREINRAMKHSG